MSDFKSGFWLLQQEEPPNQWIEGVSNQVLAFVISCIVGVATLTAFGYKTFSRPTNQRIHPEAMEHVRATRLRIDERLPSFLRGNSGIGSGNNGSDSLSGSGSHSHMNSGAHAPSAPEMREERMTSTNGLQEEICPICLVPFRSQAVPPDANSNSTQQNNNSNGNNGNSSAAPSNIPVETNCGHLFCAECLLHFHEVSAVIRPLSCPICRQSVTMLLCEPTRGLNLSEEQRNQLSAIQTYNRRFSGQPRSLMDILRDMPILIRHFGRHLLTLGGMRLFFRLRSMVFITMCIIYIVLPLDLLPEALFGIVGLFDDLFIILCAVTWMSIQYRNYLLTHQQQQHQQQR